MGWAEPKAEWAEPTGCLETMGWAESKGGWAEPKGGVSRDGPAPPPFRAAVDGAYGVGGAYWEWEEPKGGFGAYGIGGAYGGGWSL